MEGWEDETIREWISWKIEGCKDERVGRWIGGREDGLVRASIWTADPGPCYAQEAEVEEGKISSSPSKSVVPGHSLRLGVLFIVTASSFTSHGCGRLRG